MAMQVANHEPYFSQTNIKQSQQSYSQAPSPLLMNYRPQPDRIREENDEASNAPSLRVPSSQHDIQEMVPPSQ